MSHLVIVRGWPPEAEVLLQARASVVSQGDTFGLPGGSLDGIEKDVSNDESVANDVRWLVRRRAALREACEEMGEGSHHDVGEVSCALPEIEIGNGEVIPREDRMTLLPGRLIDEFVSDPSLSIVFQDFKTYFFLYHIEADEEFFHSEWQPRAIDEFRWEVDENVGTFGYEWHPLGSMRDMNLCSWVKNLFVKFDIEAALNSMNDPQRQFNGENPYPRRRTPPRSKAPFSVNTNEARSIRPMRSRRENQRRRVTRKTGGGVQKRLGKRARRKMEAMFG